MIYFNVLGQHFLILSSLRITTDLFENRSSNNSGRMNMIMIGELCVSDFSHLKTPLIINAIRCRMNWNINFVTMPYGPWWRKHRRIFHEYFHPNTITKYQPILRREARALLHRLLVTPDNFFHHIRQ